MKRMRSAERRARMIDTMADMVGRARSQADFTAEKVATACGVSSTLLYRLVSEEFRAFRAGLPGDRGIDPMVANLRARLFDAGTELDRLHKIERSHAGCPSLDDIATALARNEQLEEEVLSLRAQLEHLRRTQPLRPHLRPVDDLS